MLAASLFFIVPGIFYLVFAFRRPPQAIDHFFYVPAIFMFVPEHNRIRVGRIAVGAFLVLFGLGTLLGELYRALFGGL